ncbi:MAG TPA: acyloxyacyl hydrolase [Candidatus Brocadiia bacterium]|nr:outer membrane beta-barrel protein [Planctomycetota bacterium]MDO8092702.1 acyloxyacyl hydrolase [Candidatus Brocadiales bacterium]
MNKVKCWVMWALVIFMLPKVCVANSKIDESVLEAKSIELGGGGAFGYDDRQSISILSLLPRGGMFFARNAAAEVELPLMYIHTKESDVPALGVNINALYHLNTGTSFIPFALVGMGPVYVAGKISSTSSLPLLSQAGIGLKYFFSERAAFRLEYRFRHFSDPFTSDAGIDSDSFLFGISIFPSKK